MTEVNEKNIKNGTLKPIPMGYLRKGDRFVVMRSPSTGKGRAILAGVAAMDGNWVSENYGFRANISAYLEPETDYINVHLDGIDYSEWQSNRDRQVNTGLYARDEWSFYVTPGIWVRYSEDHARNERIKAERADAEASRLAAEALERVEARKAATKARLQSDLASLKRQVENIQATLAGLE